VDARPYDPFLLNVIDSTHPVDLYKVGLFWFENGEKRFRGSDDTMRVFHPTRYNSTTNAFDTLYPLLHSSAVYKISAERGVKKFYLDYSNGVVDTLDVTWSNGGTVRYRGANLRTDSKFSFPVLVLNRN
jgi:hypothetical protein